jgi:hypothetical protein
MSLTGCAQKVLTQPVNPALTRPIQIPTRDGAENQDIAEAYLRRGEALEECNARLREIEALSQ